MKKTIITIIAGIVLTIILVIGASYAMFYSESNFTNETSYTSGILDIELVDEEGYNTDISLTNTLPKSDEEGNRSAPYRLKLRNNGDLTYTFDVKLINTTTENSVDLDYIKISINQGTATALSELTDNIIAEDVTLNPKEEITYDIRIWLDENTPNSEMGKNFQADISTYGVGSEYTPPEVLQLDISKGAITIEEGSDSTKLYITGGGLSEETEIDNTLPIYITGSATNNGGITINSGTANITLNNVNISKSGTFRMMQGSNVNLTISGINVLDASAGGTISSLGSGIYVPSGATLTINGTGTLNATGAGCGIGGGYMLAAGTIIINEGTINASSTATGAGIGGYDVELIEINGGNITATGHDNGEGADGGAGIGGVRETSVTGTIRINGGTVYAKGGSGAAGIGGGGPMAMSCMPPTTAPNIEISESANVTAVSGGSDAEDIGNGGFSC